MGIKRLEPQQVREAKAQQKKNKKDNAGQSWATLNTNEKFAIIGQDLLARGIIDTL